MTVHDYHDALVKVRESAIDLTERDFLILAEFGGPADEQRGRDAQRRAQLRLVDPHGTVQTKSAAPIAMRPTPDAHPAVDPMWAAMIDTVMRAALAPVETRLRALERRAADVRARRAAIAALGPFAAVVHQMDQQFAAFVRAVDADLTAEDPPGR